MIDMGYYSSLIERKFKDVVGRRYEAVIREYGDFLLSEEKMQSHEIRQILLPLDICVREVPPELYEVLSTYDAEIVVMYITDAQVYEIIKKTSSEEAGETFRIKKEDYGHALVEEISREFNSRGLSVQKRMFLGSKGEQVITSSSEFDLLALSKCFGDGSGQKGYSSPLAMHITQTVNIPTILY